MDIILASASPRRRDILEKVGINFRIRPSKIKEPHCDEDAAAYASKLSSLKAMDVFGDECDASSNDLMVIGADTVVCLEGEIFGKPVDSEHARQMISKLQGGTHQVYTGVTLLARISGEDRLVTFCERTDVSVYSMSDDEIASYVAMGESMDKAGAYAIQGRFAAYIKGINGDFYNVCGLPIARLVLEMKMLGGSER